VGLFCVIVFVLSVCQMGLYVYSIHLIKIFLSLLSSMLYMDIETAGQFYLVFDIVGSSVTTLNLRLASVMVTMARGFGFTNSYKPGTAHFS